MYICLHLIYIYNICIYEFTYIQIYNTCMCVGKRGKWVKYAGDTPLKGHEFSHQVLAVEKKEKRIQRIFSSKVGC